MKVDSKVALPEELFQSLERPSAFALTTLGLDEDELQLDWLHGSVSVDLLFEALGPGFVEQAVDVMLESYDEEELSDLLKAVKAKAFRPGLTQVEEKWPIAIIVHDGVFKLTLYPVLLLVAKHLNLPTVPAYIARAESVAPDSWELRHILN